MTESDPREFEARARRALKENADSLPEEVAARLAAARSRAVSEFDDSSSRTGWRALYHFRFGSAAGLSAFGARVARVATVATAAVVLAVGLLLLDEDELVSMPPGLVVADEAEIAAAEEAELLSELEFLAWLETTDVDAG